MKRLKMWINYLLWKMRIDPVFKSDCVFCKGSRGGVLGNENLTGKGEPMCDYCSSERSKGCKHMKVNENGYCLYCGAWDGEQ